MIGPISIEGISGATTIVDPISRAELTHNSVNSTTELPEHAVTEVVKSNTPPRELPPHIHEKAKIIGQIQQDVKDIETRAANAKELESIRAKLLLGYNDATTGNISHPNVSQALNSAHTVSNIALRFIGSSSAATGWPELKKGETSKQEKNPNEVGIADQQQVIGRIDHALMAVDKLLGKLDSDQLAANVRLLNLTGSVAGLNAARSTVDSTPLSLSVAINAAEMIMTNVKAAVVSHGNISTDIVRLVMV